MRLDKDGFLEHLEDWDEETAARLAAEEDTILAEAHWEIIWLLRTFYLETQVAPAMRPFVKLVRDKFGAEKGNSIYLMELFGSSPAKAAARWAGLPRPTNCL